MKRRAGAGSWLGLWAVAIGLLNAVNSSQAVASEPERSGFPLVLFVDLPPSWVDEDPARIAQVLDQIIAGPFHILINYAASTGSADQVRQYHQMLEKRGLSEFFSVEKFFKNLGNPAKQLEFEGTEREAIEKWVKVVGRSPAVAGWYIADEEPADVTPIREHHAWLKALDPNRPTLVVTMAADTATIRSFAEVCDIIATDFYPVPRHRLVEVADVVDHLVAASRNDQPRWFVLQAFGSYLYDKAVREQSQPAKLQDLVNVHRAPTPKEMRAMAYLALAHGAQGMAVYYHRDIMMSADAQQRWQAVVDIGRDIQRIAPVLKARLMDQKAFGQDNLSIHWRAADVDGKHYILAVNPTREYQNIWFSRFAWKVRKASVVQGHGFALASDDYGTDELLIGLDALDTIVVEVE